MLGENSGFESNLKLNNIDVSGEDLFGEGKWKTLSGADKLGWSEDEKLKTQIQECWLLSWKRSCFFWNSWKVVKIRAGVGVVRLIYNHPKGIPNKD